MTAISVTKAREIFIKYYLMLIVVINRLRLQIIVEKMVFLYQKMIGMLFKKRYI